MTDVFDSKKRSDMMSKIKSSGNRSTDLAIIGWRRNYDIYGRPDFIFSNSNLTVFIDECLWHGFLRCYKVLVRNRDFWEGNRV